MNMRFRYRVKSALQFIAFAFYPQTTLLACAVFSAIVIVVLGIVMAAIPQQSAGYSIVFALTTGAAGSFFVSFVVILIFRKVSIQIGRQVKAGTSVSI